MLKSYAHYVESASPYAGESSTARRTMCCPPVDLSKHCHKATPIFLRLFALVLDKQVVAYAWLLDNIFRR